MLSVDLRLWEKSKKRLAVATSVKFNTGLTNQEVSSSTEASSRLKYNDWLKFVPIVCQFTIPLGLEIVHDSPESSSSKFFRSGILSSALFTTELTCNTLSDGSTSLNPLGCVTVNVREFTPAFRDNVGSVTVICCRDNK